MIDTIRFIGDVHGLWTSYRKIITEAEHSIQVGDFGLGFPGWEKTDPYRFSGNHYFIRGNHDNPEICRHHPNYLGDFGYNPDLHSLFFMGGAFSIDRGIRIMGRDLWPDEEIPYGIMLDEVIPLYEKHKPRIVVTHDCPTIVRKGLKSIHQDELGRNRTVKCLDTLLEIHKPEFWIHGHHHIAQRKSFESTLFISLAILDFYDLTP